MMWKSTSLALALLFTIPASAAEPFASDWAPSLKSRARLIADGAGQAGFEVRLSPGAITYWRDPGEAGVPPSFDFTGSVNLARAEVQFPAPKRIAESDGSEAFGYDREVVFPIHVEAADPSRPVKLVINANYAVCEKICLPARAALGLDLASGASPFAAEFAAARAQLPVANDAAALGMKLTPLDATSWRLCEPGSAPRDLFVEPPAGWWLTVKPEGDCFALELRQAPKDAKFPADVRATIVSAAGATETMLKLTPKL